MKRLWKKIVSLWNDMKYDLVSLEMLKYMLCGAGTVLIDVVVYTLCYELIPIRSVLLTSASNAIAWVFATLFAFYSNKLFVFKRRHNGKRQFLFEFLSFFGSRLFTLLLSMAFLVLFIDGFGWDFFWSKVIVNIFVIIINYIASKQLVFKNKNR